MMLFTLDLEKRMVYVWCSATNKRHLPLISRVIGFLYSGFIDQLLSKFAYVDTPLICGTVVWSFEVRNYSHLPQ